MITYDLDARKRLDRAPCRMAKLITVSIAAVIRGRRTGSEGRLTIDVCGGVTVELEMRLWHFVRGSIPIRRELAEAIHQRLPMDCLYELEAVSEQFVSFRGEQTFFVGDSALSRAAICGDLDCSLSGGSLATADRMRCEAVADVLSKIRVCGLELVELETWLSFADRAIWPQAPGPDGAQTDAAQPSASSATSDAVRAAALVDTLAQSLVGGTLKRDIVEMAILGRGGAGVVPTAARSASLIVSILDLSIKSHTSRLAGAAEPRRTDIDLVEARAEHALELAKIRASHAVDLAKLKADASIEIAKIKAGHTVELAKLRANNVS